jgi:hypothetical protein
MKATRATKVFGIIGATAVLTAVAALTDGRASAQTVAAAPALPGTSLDVAAKLKIIKTTMPTISEKELDPPFRLSPRNPYNASSSARLGGLGINLDLEADEIVLDPKVVTAASATPHAYLAFQADANRAYLVDCLAKSKEKVTRGSWRLGIGPLTAGVGKVESLDGHFTALVPKDGSARRVLFAVLSTTQAISLKYCEVTPVK